MGYQCKDQPEMWGILGGLVVVVFAQRTVYLSTFRSYSPAVPAFVDKRRDFDESELCVATKPRAANTR
jgi:hypothetical protein